jgi:hypothetical protein
MSYMVLILILAPTLMAEENRDRRVRASEPTVVTVEGKRDEVEQQAPRQREPRQGTKGMRRGAAAAAKGVVGAVGWLLNTDEDVPARRDRKR